MRPLVTIVAAAAALSVPAAAAAVPPPLAFGRLGGNIRPFTVTIGAAGDVHADGAVQIGRTRVAPVRVAALVRLAVMERFFSLPLSTRCPGTLPDFAFRWIRVRAAGRMRTVQVRGGCGPAFQRLYAAIARAVSAR